MDNFQNLIDYSTVDDLKFRIKSLPFSCAIPSRKAEVASVLFNALMNPDNLQSIWNHLSEVQKLALQEAVHNQAGYMDGFVFWSKYQKEPPSTEDWSLYRSRDKDNGDKALSPFFYPDRRYGSSRRIPNDLLAFLKPHVPLPPHFSVPTAIVDGDEIETSETPQYTEAELNVLLNTIKVKKLKVSPKTGQPSKALLNQLCNKLNEPYQKATSLDDESAKSIKAFGWIQILRAALWFKETNGELQINLKKAALQQRHCDVIKQLFLDWKDRSEFDEFSRINQIKGQKGKGQKYFTNVLSRRDACIETLRSCPPEEWVSFDDYLRLMAVEGQFFNITFEPYSLYIGDSTYGRIHDGTFLTNAYSRCLIMEYFATLGIVDIAYVTPESAQDNYYDRWGQYDLDYLSIYDGLKYIRLTKLGAYVLGVVDTYIDVSESTKTSIALLPKNRVQFMQPPTTSERVFLTNYADEVTDQVWQLCTSKILSHLENGGDLEEIQSFLSERDEQPYFPTQIEHLFKTLESNKNAVRLEGRFLLLKCDTESIAKNIASAPKLQKLCQRVGKDQLIIPEGKESLFRQLVHELAYAMPIQS
ncbi:hypothetical protein BCT78_10915 [Vibrio breoganii]|uniref:hypothetical protein n=1 Tax=Vibrio breoganii TaxID=553239 RepID=UPI000C8202D7|nr:hypothetical protein [Vibrio breoganii]PMF83543.1 hypothetical protein BCV08_14745 [Vibrio breoganii]PML36003.1 hypothetical protein BCT78_10915 [Vibrio breoganii]PML93003.1 hypothetical protein BCT64_14950 [Vibrio breoganii]PMM79862.1 hypothetical protein BCT45_16020 [Vibrio breoganii]PMN70181.1 hypothetical protein BCT28_18015 [Vibrio breoganii]